MFISFTLAASFVSVVFPDAAASEFVGNPRDTGSSVVSLAVPGSPFITLSTATLTVVEGQLDDCVDTIYTDPAATFDALGDELTWLPEDTCALYLDALVVVLTGAGPGGDSFHVTLSLAGLNLDLVAPDPGGRDLVLELGSPGWLSPLLPALSGTGSLVIGAGHPLHSVLSANLLAGAGLYIDSDDDGEVSITERVQGLVSQ